MKYCSQCGAVYITDRQYCEAYRLFKGGTWLMCYGLLREVEKPFAKSKHLEQSSKP